MKKFSKLIALALACVLALTMLTACGGNTVKREDQILGVMNEVRKEHKLDPVQVNSELSKYAEALTQGDSKVRQISIDGVNYTVYPFIYRSTPGKIVELDTFKKNFEQGVQMYLDGDTKRSTSFIGNPNMKYVGIYDKIENNQEIFGIVVAFPEGAKPWN